MTLRIFNTLGHRKQVFKLAKKGYVRFYACGPTVYQRAHIGNLRTYVNEDILKRVLLLNGYKVKHVMNITDVGHLEHDLDTGRDKVEEAARSLKKSAWDLAREHEEIFKEDLKKLNIIFPQAFPRATDHIKEQIDMIKKLEKKGLTYQTSDGIYFDTAKFKNYGALVKSKLKGLRSGARADEREKKNQTDFALWKFSHPTRPAAGGGEARLAKARRQMEWPSPWGVGFPGWHIECSAMSIKYLGLPIDIHAGGIDHIHPHHTNEIAQSEGAFGGKFVNYWMHSEFLRVNEGRMGKSEGNAVSLKEVEEKGFDPLDFRYLTLTAHYRSPLVFSWEALKAARSARLKLEERTREAFIAKKGGVHSGTGRLDERLSAFKKRFLDQLNDDLNMPKALAVLWKELGNSKFDAATYNLLLFADHVLGLNLREVTPIRIPEKVRVLVQRREKARKEKKWASADAARKEIETLGFIVEDTPGGAKVKVKI